MTDDIRDKPYISHDDVIGLNFIKNPCPFVFRRHFRQGLRSHILEILSPWDLELEKYGIVVNGVRWFPKAKPRNIFRLFRTRLKTLDQGMAEVRRVKITEQYLAPDYLAKSEEFIVDYLGPSGPDLMLCGFQEYVAGEIVDPWSILNSGDLVAVMCQSLGNGLPPGDPAGDQWIRHARAQAAMLIAKIKRMILEQKHIPDLAGVGNLVMVPSGEIKLVDMNNISRVTFDAQIPLDDRGYPVCDKSIQALSLLERNILGHSVDAGEAIYKHFLDSGRRRAVQALEEGFHSELAPAAHAKDGPYA